jgi:cysteine-rich repeat protein
LAVAAALLGGVAAEAQLTPEQKCQSAVLTFSANYERARIRAIDKCEQDNLKGKNSPPLVCPDGDAKAMLKISKALAKMEKLISVKCCGKDKTCGAGSGVDADLPLSAIGWDVFVGARCVGGVNDGEPCVTDGNCPGGLNDLPPAGVCVATNVCPNIESSQGCDLAVAGMQDVAPCLACIGDLATDQAIGFSYASLKAPGADKKLELCKREMKKATLFYDKFRNFMRVCQNKVAKGKLAGPCPDSLTATKLQKEREKLDSFIAKKCGGPDKAFGGGDDFHVDLVGAPISCPGVTVPGGSNCAEQIETVQDVAECLVCMNEYKTLCADAAASPVALPAVCNPTCGNGSIDPGETCDDGNVVDGDGCPSNCVINPCTPPFGTVTAIVNFTAPADIAGATIYIDYPDGEVRIPGTGNQAAVQNRIFLSTGDFFNPNDLDYAVQIVQIDSGGNAFTGSELMQIEFDTCDGASISSSDFTCRVLDAASAGASPVSVAGVTCSVQVP